MDMPAIAYESCRRARIAGISIFATLAAGVLAAALVLGSVPSANACDPPPSPNTCGDNTPLPPPTAKQQKFYGDMRAAGVVPLNNNDVNFNGAGYLLCQFIWYNYLSPGQLDAIRRVITYRDFNQVQAIAKGDLCPDGPHWSF
jgi:hypothetical protein